MDFFQKYRHILVGILILVVVLQIPIYWKQDRSLSVPGRILYTLAYYPQQLGKSVFDGIELVTNRYVFLINTQADNQRLEAENALLRGELYRIEEIRQENKRLRTLLDMRARNQYQAAGARIIGLDGSNWFRSFTIDAGSREGIARGMPAVTHEGLVGTVVAVSGRSSKVLPIVDVHSSVEVVSSRTRDRAILVGRGSNRPFLNYLERSADVQPGDVFVTSGLARTFPQGLPVGVISEVRQKSYGLFQEATLAPIVDFGKLENMLVLKYREGESIPEFKSAPTEETRPLLLSAEGAAEEARTEPEKPGSSLIEARTSPSPRATPAPRETRAEPASPPVPQPDPAVPEAAPEPAPVRSAPATERTPEPEPAPDAAPVPAPTPAPRVSEPVVEQPPEPEPAPTPAPTESEPAVEQPPEPESTTVADPDPAPTPAPTESEPAAEQPPEPEPEIQSAPPSMPSALPGRSRRPVEETPEPEVSDSPTAVTEPEVEQ